MTIDLLKEMPQIIGEIGLEAAALPHPSTLCKAFDGMSMNICRMLLRQSAQLHDSSKHGGWSVLHVASLLDDGDRASTSHLDVTILVLEGHSAGRIPGSVLR